MNRIKLAVAAVAFATPVAIPAIASASASPSHFLMRQENMFTEFFWKADPTNTCGPEAHVVGFGGFQTSPSGGPATPLAVVFIEYFDRCTGAYESVYAYNDQQVNLSIQGLSGTEIATVYPVVCDVNGCAQDLSQPIDLNLSVNATSTTHNNLAGQGRGTYYQFAYEFTGVSHYGPVSGSVTFTTSSGDVLTVFPNYTDPVQPLQTGAGAGGALTSSQSADLFVTFN